MATPLAKDVIAEPATLRKRKGNQCELEAKRSKQIEKPIETPISELPEDAQLLYKLFSAMDNVLVLMSCTKSRPTLPTVRRNVELASGRDLTEDRLCLLLAVAHDLLEAVWYGRGSTAVLQIHQKDQKGQPYLPSGPDRAERLAAFRHRITFGGKYAPLTLPPRPDSPHEVEEAKAQAARRAESLKRIQDDEEKAAATAALFSAARREREGARARSGSTGKSRLSELRARIQQREAADKVTAERRARIQELTRELEICTEAMAAHRVVLQLFARAYSWNEEEADQSLKKEEASCTSQSEIVSVLTGRRRSLQSERPIDEETAKSAVQCLAKHASGWFRMDAGVHNSHKQDYYLHRLTTGAAPAAAAALELEAKRLKEERKKLENVADNQA
eukprot:CAMPEP_0206471296 /NCGR_PEP_ID=MMETSP0324_2-20121206/31472_1 /ASSEMBLY_ACC=CAM_ASM_000836 /TAXON_ID=2866 /ORGANISM="Crypthecodinium cohnii, Strain Seligo" /LENGTH=389 /DNA_ID=CAMNT_0053945581 /DNA_START=239 /DNA_END=1408 /DNA_ORIENTATION=+